MRRLLMAGLAILALACTPALRALDEPPEAKATPKQQFDAILAEYQKAQQTFSQEYSRAKTDEERNKLFNEKYPNPAKFAERFRTIVEKNPDDPAAIEALVWTIQLGGQTIKNPQRIAGLVLKNAANPKIGPVAQVLSYTYSPFAEGPLRAIAEKNTDRTVRGQATLGLAQYLNRQLEIVRMFRDDPKRAATLEPRLKMMGFEADDIARIKATDPDALAKEAETLFDKVVKDYNDVSSGRGTLGKVAAGELNEIRNLGIGKPCPEIAGEDIDGKALKLSDYKGKVVVVDFWGDW